MIRSGDLNARGWGRGPYRLALLCLAALGGGAVQAVSATSDAWTIDSGPIDPKHYFGESVANGMIGVLSSATPFQSRQTLLYGTYETLWPGSVSSAVRSFNFLNLAFSIDGVRIERLAQTQNFHQTLQLKDAALTTTFDYQDMATVTYTVRALRQLPQTALLEVSVVAKRPIIISALSLMDVPSTAGAITWRKHPTYAWLTQVQRYATQTYANSKQPLKMAAASGRAPSGMAVIAAAQTYVFDEPLDLAPLVTQGEIGLSFGKDLSASVRYHFALVGSTITSAQVDDPINEAQRLTAAAAVQGTGALIDRHEKAWAELWRSDILVQGDDELQRDLHSMIYHLYSFIREGSELSIPPMGLSGASNDYLGHIFWDAETWMFPTLLALQPPLARAMLDYRYARLPAARKNAALNGYRGAQFPWESAASGDEDTWSEALSGTLEIHVTADVALAAWDYYRVTQDRAWLRDRGFPLIRDAADFWASRVTRAGPGHFDIKHVVGADEYAVDVDNDAFTNAAAKKALAAASTAAKILGIPPDPDWEQVRGNIPILTFPDGTTREHATYHGETIKQADANLLAYPLREIADPIAIARDLSYYASRSDAEGPAMTKSILAILYEKLQRPDEALELFKSGYIPNRRPPFGTLTEKAHSENPYFATGAGGWLQAMLYGFGGLEITDQGLAQEASPLPAAWRSLTLTGIGPQRQTYIVKQK